MSNTSTSLRLSHYVVRVFAHEELLISGAHGPVHALPGFIAWHEESVFVLLDVGFVLIPVGFHATDEIVLSGELVSFAANTRAKVNKAHPHWGRVKCAQSTS